VNGLSAEEAAALPIPIESILRQGDFSNWRTDAGDLDVMKSMASPNGPRRYDDLTGDSLLVECAGVRIRVASLDAIVASKEAANRPKDQQALPELHQLQEELRRKGPAQGRAPSPPPSARRDPGPPRPPLRP
jgi:hypothetical protein